MWSLGRLLRSLPRTAPVTSPHCFQWRSFAEVLANRDIPFPRVRVVDDSGLLGDFQIQEALAVAQQRRTDLVVLSGQVDPPLCRLVNLHVYLDELEKQAASKEQKRREQQLREFSFDPAMRVKGMRFAAVIAEHDFERKVNKATQTYSNCPSKGCLTGDLRTTYSEYLVMISFLDSISLLLLWYIVKSIYQSNA